MSRQKVSVGTWLVHHPQVQISDPDHTVSWRTQGSGTATLTMEGHLKAG